MSQQMTKLRRDYKTTTLDGKAIAAPYYALLLKTICEHAPGSKVFDENGVTIWVFPTEILEKIEDPYFRIGDPVIKLGADYTAGRIGTVIEVDHPANRARVSWERDRFGVSMKLRTWVRFADLTKRK